MSEGFQKGSLARVCAFVMSWLAFAVCSQAQNADPFGDFFGGGPPAYSTNTLIVKIAAGHEAEAHAYYQTNGLSLKQTFTLLPDTEVLQIERKDLTLWQAISMLRNSSLFEYVQPELLYGTFPGPAPTPPLRISATVLANNQVQLNLTGPGNLACVVEATTDPVARTWSSIGPVMLSSSGVGTFIDADTSSFSYRFYRVKSGAGPVAPVN